MHLILAQPYQGWYNYYPYVANEELETQSC